jgi:alpha-mannosidase
MQPDSPLTFHLIPNAHLDPVWLWDWREGFTEMVTTTRTILDLMDEYPELTFIRGEAFVYRALQQADPATFERVRQRIAEGRWEVVGGTMLQPDMNMPATETMVRQLLYAQRYFQEQFGLRARAGWSADCFGHSAHLPDLLAAAGIEYYAYTRPTGVPESTTFWWVGPAGGRLLVHHPTVGWYGTERDEMLKRLDGLLAQADAQGGSGPRVIPCLMGLGDHGGHPTRRQMDEVRSWAAAHPQVRVVFSGLTRYFDAVKTEIRTRPDLAIPVFRGEINFAPRGVYAANARFKFAYCKAEAAVRRAERIASGIAAASGTQPLDLREAWDAVLFNTFHDIMPGSSVERAYDEQHDWLSLAPHAARRADQQAFNVLSARVDTQVRRPVADMPGGVPFLAFNPHPWPYQGFLELETGLDYRPIWKYSDHPQDLPVAVRAPEGPLPLQKMEVESLYATFLNIRTRAVVPVTLPPFGWKVLEMAYDEEAPALPPAQPVHSGANTISNEQWEVSAALGAQGVQVSHQGSPVFGAGGLAVVTIEDPWGIWGDFNDSPESLSLTTVRQRWSVTRVEVTEPGPLRATLRVRLEGGRSRIDLAFALCAGRDALDVEARAFWDERCARLELALEGGYTQAAYDVLGGQVQRASVGEVPGGRWVHAQGPNGEIGFASDALYGFNLTPRGDLLASIARATRYAADAPAAVEDHPWRPVLDSGELRFRFLLTTDGKALPHLAAELVEPPLAMTVTPSAGDWARSGSLLSLEAEPQSVRLLALKPAEDGRGWILRLHSQVKHELKVGLTWLGQAIYLPGLAPLELATYRLDQSADGGWSAERCTLLE